MNLTDSKAFCALECLQFVRVEDATREQLTTPAHAHIARVCEDEAKLKEIANRLITRKFLRNKLGFKF